MSGLPSLALANYVVRVADAFPLGLSLELSELYFGTVELPQTEPGA